MFYSPHRDKSRKKVYQIDIGIMATVVLEIPVAARISMLERLDSSQGTDNNDGAFRTIRARPSGKRETSDSRQKTMNLQSGSSACLQDKIRPRRREADSGTSKGGRSTTFISKTKYHLVKMTGEQFEKGLLVEDLYPKFRGSYINKHFESMATSGGAESEDSSSQGSGICDKRLSLLSGLSHSDYETCGSQTSLEDYDNDRLSTSSGLLVKDDFNSSSSSSSFSLNKLSQVSDGRTSRPVSSVLGDSEFDELESYSELEEQSKSEEGQSGHKSKPERPACLDQGMAATVAWIKNELVRKHTFQCLIVQISK